MRRRIALMLRRRRTASRPCAYAAASSTRTRRPRAPSAASAARTCVWALERHMDHIADESGSTGARCGCATPARRASAMVNGQELDDAGLRGGLRARRGDRAVGRAQAARRAAARRRHRRGDVADQPGPPAPTRQAQRGRHGRRWSARRPRSAPARWRPACARSWPTELGVDVERRRRRSTPDTDAAGYDAGAQGSRTTYGVGTRRAAPPRRCAGRSSSAAGGHARGGRRRPRAGRRPRRPSPAPQRRVTARRRSPRTRSGRPGPIVRDGQARRARRSPFDDELHDAARCSHVPAPATTCTSPRSRSTPTPARSTILRYVVAQDVGQGHQPAGHRGPDPRRRAPGHRLRAVRGPAHRRDGPRARRRASRRYRLPTRARRAADRDRRSSSSPCPYGPHGAKGAGEPPIVPVAAVIANAVADAVGTRFNTLPITPFDILAALREVSADGQPR